MEKSDSLMEFILVVEIFFPVDKVDAWIESMSRSWEINRGRSSCTPYKGTRPSSKWFPVS